MTPNRRQTSTARGTIDLLDSTHSAGQPVSTQRLLRFLIPSMIGVLLFMTPMLLGG